MIKTIYIDILFLINFIINYLILFTSAYMGTAQIRRLRLFLSAFIGAVYGTVLFFPSLSFLSSVIAKLSVSVLMVLCAFGLSNIIKMTLLFLSVSLAFGGAALIASLFGSFLEISNGIYYIHISAPALLLSSFLAYILLSVVLRRSASRADRKLSRILVCSKSSEIELIALHDTGNSLRAPFTNAPVVISDYSSLRPILPDGAKEILDTCSDYVLSIDKLSSFGNFSLIPYKTVGSSFELMLAFHPDRIEINSTTIDGALVAISCHSISDGGAYSALI